MSSHLNSSFTCSPELNKHLPDKTSKAKAYNLRFVRSRIRDTRCCRLFSPSTRQQVKLSLGFLMQIDKLRIHLRHVLGCLLEYLLSVTLEEKVLAWLLNGNYTKACWTQGSGGCPGWAELSCGKTVSDHMWVKFMWSALGIHRRHKRGQSERDQKGHRTCKKAIPLLVGQFKKPAEFEWSQGSSGGWRRMGGWSSGCGLWMVK